MRYYEPVVGDAKISNSLRKEYTKALRVVFYFLTDDYRKNMEKLPDAISIVKGLFNRVLREDRDNWQMVNHYFGGVPKEEIPDIADKLKMLRKAVLYDKTNQIAKYYSALKETNILAYIYHFIYYDGIQEGTIPPYSVESIKRKTKNIASKEDESNDSVALPPQNEESNVLPVSEHACDAPDDKTAPNGVNKTNPKRPSYTLRNSERPPADVIWIYKAKYPCRGHEQAVESVRVIVESVRDHREYPINANYCSVCQKYYINAESFNRYAERYGIPLVKVEITDEFTEAFGGLWNEESVLHALGYNVNAQDALPAWRRQEILKEAIQANIVTKAETVAYLERLINRNRNRGNFQIAVSKWREDLSYILDYHLLEQQSVRGVFKKL